MTMTVDHIGVILYQDIEFLRVIGRLSFPLFAYLLVLGMESTRNIRNYLLRLFIFAFISQIPFSLATEVAPLDYLNIFFTLGLGLLCLHLMKTKQVYAIVPLLASLILPFDYGIYGIVIIGCMYILRENTTFGVIALLALNSLLLVPWNTQFLSIAAIPFIILHKNGPLYIIKEKNENYRIPSWRKYFFYIYYPLHLTLLYAIKISFLA